MTLKDLSEVLKGGSGSGNFGHGGRKGKVGGSIPKGGSNEPVSKYHLYGGFTYSQAQEKAPTYQAKLDELKKKYPVSKDLGSIRPKGVMVEDIASVLQETAKNLGIDQETIEFSSRGGIPTIKSFFNNSDDWEKVKRELKMGGWSR